MTYFHFLTKKAYKGKLSWIAICISLLVVFICLGFNIKNQHADTLKGMAESQISMDTKQMRIYQKHNRGVAPEVKSDLIVNKRILKAIHNKQWRRAYRTQIAVNSQILKSEKQVSGSDPEMTNSLKSESNLYRALSRLNIPQQSEESPATGISFLLYVEQWIAPVLIVLTIVFICSQLYTKRFIGRLDKDSLLPITSTANVSCNIMTGWFISLALLLIILGLGFLAASIISGIGDTRYPFELFSKQLSYKIYIPQSQIILPTIVLRILSSFFVVTFIFFFAVLTKKTLTTLFFNILLLIGTNLLTPFVEPISRIAQYLPTSYFNGVNILSNRMEHDASNYQINYNHGIEVLIIWTALFGIASYILQSIRQHQNH